MKYLLAFLAFAVGASAVSGQEIANVEQLVVAVQTGEEGSLIRIGPGRFELEAPLVLKSGMKLLGAGVEETIITHAMKWTPETDSLPKGELKPEESNSQAYLIRLQTKAKDISIANLTLLGPQMHGAIFGIGNQRVQIHNLRVEDVLYSGIRGYFWRDSRIMDCDFVGAGGKWKRGKPGVDGGTSGGAIFMTWMSSSEIAHNRISFGPKDRRPGKSGGHFGIKGRGGKNIHIHHNTIGVNFAIEFPFEGNQSMQIDHNILHGVVSIPKHAGGKRLTDDERSFHIHHNYFTTSYAIEFPRNNVEIDHNLFDFKLEQDGGNLVSGFGGVDATGPAWFHNNLVSNPGRGVIWNQKAFSRLVIRNNHIIARTTSTPRQEGLFGVGGTDFSQTQILDNIVECLGQSRPLLRSESSYDADIRNNHLINVSDVGRYKNEKTGNPIGLEKPLAFRCGVHGELTIDGWDTSMRTDQ